MAADVLSIGLSGTSVSERALATTSHNIANAQTEGFSRQRLDTVTRPPQYSGVGSLGTGVEINNIERAHDDFVSEEMRTNASLAKSLNTNFEFTSQIDNMLADPNAGLAPTINQLFKAVNNISNDPASLSARQVLIGEANALSERFSYLNHRFDSLRNGTNETLRSQVEGVNNLAKAIADVNYKITMAKEITQGDPNDLLDQRERLLHELSEKVVTSITEQENGAINVFIGNGQSLVLGIRNANLALRANEHDPAVQEIVFRDQGVDAIVTKFMRGGTIGGLLDFRNNMLDSAQNELGRIAIGISKTFNDQHHKGMTLENELGGDFFKPIDKTAPVTLPSNLNKGDYELTTTITSVDNLSTSDYLLEYNAGAYTLIKESDNTIIGKFNSLPQNVESEGFTIDLKHGTIIENGDSFLLRPTNYAADKFDTVIQLAQDIAAASPVRVRRSIHNLGSAEMSVSNITNINSPTFTTEQGTLSPTITVRFVDENHIELLDEDGEVIRARQLNDQNKSIPATSGLLTESGEAATPATPAIPSIVPAIPAIPPSHSQNEDDETSPSRSDSRSEDDETSPSRSDSRSEDDETFLDKKIVYDPKLGINLFPTPSGYDSGYAVQISGKAKAGDTYTIELNKDAVGNNINILELGDLQSKATLANGSSSYGEVYSQLVSRVGSKTHELDVNREAQGILYRQTIAQREAISGVNLDEEAANLVKFQQAYNANAKVIGAGSEMFDTLMGILK